MRYFYRSKIKEVIYDKHGKLTHEQIAKITKLQRPTITIWMSDRLFRRLDMDILEPIANWLECRPEDLYEIVEVDELSEVAGE